MNGITLVEENGGVSVRIPMKIRKRGGRKEIQAPSGLEDAVDRSCRGNAFSIALARAHCWLEMLDSGDYSSIREMARSLGLCPTYVTRVLRYTLLAPDIIEAVLNGNEPESFTQGKLIGAIPAKWAEQREKWGSECS